LGDLKPGDGAPIWIKRTTFGSVLDDEINGFQIRFNGSLIKNTNIQIFPSKPCFYYE
jgi:hypothetical protein